MTQEEIVHVPTAVNHHRHHHVQVEQIVDVEVPQVKEELVHVKEIIQQKRMVQQMFEQVVEVLIRVTEEEIVPCLK